MARNGRFWHAGKALILITHQVAYGHDRIRANALEKDIRQPPGQPSD